MEVTTRYESIPAEERRYFINWMVKTFKCTTKDITFAIGQEEVYQMFLFYRRKPTMNIDQMIELIHAIGWISDRSHAIPITPIIEELKPWSAEDLAYLLKIKWNPIVRSQIYQLYKRAQQIEQLKQSGVSEANRQIITQDDYLEVFYNTWCVDLREFKYADKIGTTYKKAIIRRIRRAYHTFCEINGCSQLPWGIVKEFLTKQKKHTSSTGYACRVSGQSFLHFLYVPGNLDEDEFERATKFNQLIFKFGDGYYNTAGIPVDLNKPEAVEHLRLHQLAQAGLVPYQGGLVMPPMPRVTDDNKHEEVIEGEYNEDTSSSSVSITSPDVVDTSNSNENDSHDIVSVTNLLCSGTAINNTEMVLLESSGGAGGPCVATGSDGSDGSDGSANGTSFSGLPLFKTVTITASNVPATPVIPTIPTTSSVSRKLDLDSLIDEDKLVEDSTPTPTSIPTSIPTSPTSIPVTPAVANILAKYDIQK